MKSVHSIKSPPILIPIFHHTQLSKNIVSKLGYELGQLTIHQFPDEEIMIRIETEIKNRDVILFANLEKPIPKIFPLISASCTAKALGARQIKLLVPYLPFMRQDKAFHMGEGITSKHFGEMLSNYFDELITMDPHLHRFHSLSEIFMIKVQVIHAAGCIAQWIKQNVEDPLLIGPDIESKQWVKQIAEGIKAPFLILTKSRKGDSEVQIALSGIEPHKDKNPILIDDIISTGETMIEAARLLKSFNLKSPICIAIHGLFSETSYTKLQKSNLHNIVTCNTVAHETNQIDVSDEFIKALQKGDKC